MSTQDRFKRLAAELRAHGVQSEYLSRIDARLTREQRLENLEAEIAQEVAAALGRTDLRVNLAFAELELCKARYEQAKSAASALAVRRELAEAFNQQRQVAQGRLRDLVIHREAIGFRRNQVLSEIYPVPPRMVVPDA